MKDNKQNIQAEIVPLESYTQIKKGDFFYAPNPVNFLPKYVAKPTLVKVTEVTENSFSYIGQDKESSINFSGTISGPIPPELMIIRRQNKNHLEHLVGPELAHTLWCKKQKRDAER